LNARSSETPRAPACDGWSTQRSQIHYTYDVWKGDLAQLA